MRRERRRAGHEAAFAKATSPKGPALRAVEAVLVGGGSAGGA